MEPPGATQHPVEMRAHRAGHQTGYQEKRRNTRPLQRSFRSPCHETPPELLDHDRRSGDRHREADAIPFGRTTTLLQQGRQPDESAMHSAGHVSVVVTTNPHQDAPRCGHRRAVARSLHGTSLGKE
jgi:hypothetical protein